MAVGHEESSEQHAHPPFAALLIGALGVVYGDIGTSPLYAIRECFHPTHGVTPSPENILGVLSLVFWSLLLVVSVKYLVFITRADNHGEGGILALLSLAMPRSEGKRAYVVVMAGLVGASLLYSEGMLTPAISVLSAVEGLAIVRPELEHVVVPISVVVLVLLFVIQARGTGRVGAVFGPFMFVWFVAIGIAGARWIAEEPSVLAAVNPWYALHFLFGETGGGLWIMGSVVLCITGAEALYADMGHFGARPIRFAWAAIVLPGLLLNYFGQGALLLRDSTVENPFYGTVPTSMLVPMLCLATGATVIASQALISGAFSLTRQAAQLGFLPRVAVVQTSSTEKGQIYVPAMNWVLMLSCLALVFGFGDSSRLASAYGLAVTGTMTCTSFLFFRVAKRWWGVRIATLVCVGFLTIDVAYFTSTLNKFLHGGWVPVAIAALLLTLMTTWRKGRRRLAEFMHQGAQPFITFIEEITAHPPARVPGTAVFMTSAAADIPPVLQHHLRHNKVLHSQIVLLSITTEDVPRVRRGKLVDVEELGHGFFRVVGHYGFAQTPRVTELLRACEKHGLHTEPTSTSFFLGREKLVITRRRGMSRWRKALFSFLSRNSRSATDFFRIPPDRVVEIGMQVEL